MFTNNQKETYQSPTIEVFNFKVEAGFAASGVGSSIVGLNGSTLIY